MRSGLWIDVEDLFIYAEGHKRPTGIQRLAFEIHRALQDGQGAGGSVHFVRHDQSHNSFRVVCWADVAALFTDLSNRDAVSSPMRPKGIRPHGAVGRYVRSVAARLPFALRLQVSKAARSQVEAWRASVLLFLALAHATPGGLMRVASRISRWRPFADDRRAVATEADFAAMVRPGDTLLVLGSPWSHPNYTALVGANWRKHGIRCALLVHDIIPLRHPEWFEPDLVRLFRASMGEMLAQCDILFAVSRATADDVTNYARELDVVLPRAVLTLPIGTGFGTQSSADARCARASLPAAGSYALIVSTIEPRKNHLLLFRVWQRLLHEMPPDRVPTLVFAGHVGWLVTDLIQQIANTNYLNGKLVLIEDPTDHELAALYRNCLFTLFPSLYEGWGLPVTESLAHGKPCVISNRTSLPEAGGSLAKCFDPDNLHEAYAVIREVIEDRSALEQWETRVRREFTPVPWSATACAILSGLRDQKVSLSQEARSMTGAG